MEVEKKSAYQYEHPQALQQETEPQLELSTPHLPQTPFLPYKLKPAVLWAWSALPKRGRSAALPYSSSTSPIHPDCTAATRCDQCICVCVSVNNSKTAGCLYIS